MSFGGQLCGLALVFSLFENDVVDAAFGDGDLDFASYPQAA